MHACAPMKNEETIYSLCLERKHFFRPASRFIALSANDVVNKTLHTRYKTWFPLISKTELVHYIFS